MLLFLAALAMLFAASLLAYVLIRFASVTPTFNPITNQQIAAVGPALGAIKLPAILWVSTAIILVSSFTIHQALASVRRERQAQLRQWMLATLLLGIAFIVVQLPALINLLRGEFVDPTTGAPHNTRLFQFAFVLVLVHALHVIGGLLPLAHITRQAHGGKYDHEVHQPVKLIAMYWHFLDVVWAVMFVVLLAIG